MIGSAWTDHGQCLSDIQVYEISHPAPQQQPQFAIAVLAG
jgi:hypothetical protein